MKTRSTIVSFLILVTCEAIHAQEVSNQILELDPDQYTDHLLGEYQLPPGTRMYSLTTESPESSVPTLETFSADMVLGGENTQAYLLHGEEAKATAALMYFKRISSEIQWLGKENAVRIYSNGFDISSQEAAGLIDFINAVEDEQESMIKSARVESCLNFNASIYSTQDSSPALEEMTKAESEIHNLLMEYFAGIDARLRESTPPNVYDHFNEQMENMQGNLRSFSVNSLDILEATGRDPKTFYQDLCSAALR